MSHPAVRVEGLTKIYKGELGQKDFQALENLDCEVMNGEVFAFLGPNGAGKTTTIKILTRLLFSTAGRVWLLGCENKTRRAMEKVGYLPEQPNFYGYLTGRECLDFIARIFGFDATMRKDRISSLLKKVGLEKRADEAIRGYSRGMIQRLGLAQALINDPSLVILDEPMASLDPLGRRDFRDMILGLKNEGKTVFFSSHILSDAEMIADRVCIINKGKKVSVGRVDELLRSHLSSVEISFELSPALLPKLEIRQAKLIVHDTTGMVTLNSENDVPLFLKKLDKLGGKVVSVVPRRRSLEEVFMSEIGS